MCEIPQAAEPGPLPAFQDNSLFRNTLPVPPPVTLHVNFEENTTAGSFTRPRGRVLPTYRPGGFTELCGVRQEFR